MANRLADGIHGVTHKTDPVTLSLRVYGKHIVHTGRFTLDPVANPVRPFVLRGS